MRTQQRYQLQSLRRVQQFLDAHADEVGVVNGTHLRKELDTLVARLEPTVTEQATRARETRGERNNQRALELELTRKHMDPITKFARAELTGVPNFAALVPETKNLVGDRLLEVARAMSAAAAPFAALFVAGHFPADFLAQLATSVDAVKASIGVRSVKQLQKVNATQRVGTAVAGGRALVTRLDARVARLIAGDTALREEWRVAKRVVAKPGVARTPAAVLSPVPAQTPAPASLPGTVQQQPQPAVQPSIVPAAQQLPATRAA